MPHSDQFKQNAHSWKYNAQLRLFRKMYFQRENNGLIDEATHNFNGYLIDLEDQSNNIKGRRGLQLHNRSKITNKYLKIHDLVNKGHFQSLVDNKEKSEHQR